MLMIPLILLRGGASAFSPISLTPQMWIDPSDLTTMFQDTAGTTPVTADGQSVARINDKSGNGRHFLQASASKRPIYKTNGTLSWLLFDGIDDGLDRATPALPATSAFVCGLQLTTSKWVTITDMGSFFAVADPGGGALAADAGAGASVTYRVNKVAATATRVGLSAAMPISSINVLTAESLAISAWLTFNLGDYGGGWFLTGKYFGHVMTGALNATDRGNLETWLGAKAGIVI